MDPPTAITRHDRGDPGALQRLSLHMGPHGVEGYMVLRHPFHRGAVFKGLANLCRVQFAQPPGGINSRVQVAHGKAASAIADDLWHQAAAEGTTGVSQAMASFRNQTKGLGPVDGNSNALTLPRYSGR